MSTSKPYHHGDLRNALLEAAEAMVDADVSRELNLRQLARAAGVSHAAPYKHFADRDALVDALAERWIADFVATTEAAAEGLRPGEALVAAGIAYLHWAVAHPSRFAFIFDPAVNPGPDSDTDAGAQARRHTELLQRLVGAAIADGALPPDPAVEGIRLWGTVHGLATLAILGLVSVTDAEAAVRGSL